LITSWPEVSLTDNAGTEIVSPGPAAAIAARSDPGPLSAPFVTVIVLAAATGELSASPPTTPTTSFRHKR
jgi:hypothetical protein